MKPMARRVMKLSGAALVLLLVAGLVAPRIGANRFRPRIQAALEKALDRRVEIGEVHFNVFTGLGFAMENVVIYDDPAFGIEPVAYVSSLEAVPRIWSLFTRRLEFSSIRLDAASINLAKTRGRDGPGRWNFEGLLNRSLMVVFPEIHVRSGRINFKSGDTKSVFYLTETDLDIYPPNGDGAWSVRFSGAPARTDRPAHGFGAFRARGSWSKRDLLDLDVEMEESAIADMITLVHGQGAGVHGSVSSRLHFTGPLHDIRIAGRLTVEDVHRWDQLPPSDERWPLTLRGRLNLPAQTLELETAPAEKGAPPLSLRFRAANYLSQPRWAVAATWNRFPLAPLMEVARHMGAPLPQGLALTGTLDGVLGYQGSGGLQGELAFHNTLLTIPDSPPVRFEHARLLFEDGEVRLAPALVRAANDDQAQLDGAYRWATQGLELAISTASMNVASLRSQVALAAVPWLEQVSSGTWSGQLRYRNGQDGGWTGQIEMRRAELPAPGLAEPVLLDSARAHINGPRLLLDRVRAHVGKVAVEGEYRYEPAAVRPHRFRLSIPEADAAQLESFFLPTIYRRRGLLARALNLGRTPVPEWLAARRMEGTVLIGSLTLGASRIERLRGRLKWDGTRVRVERLTAGVDDGIVNGTLTINLRNVKPAYLFTGRLKTVSCRSGTVDAEGMVETLGTGRELLANLQSQGLFSGRGLEFGVLPPVKTISGGFRMVWAKPEPLLSFSDLELSMGEETYTGRGTTRQDGRLLIVLSSGSREVHVGGTLAKLHVEVPPVP